MRPETEQELLRRTQGLKKILDVGGAHHMFPTATHVIDILSYEESRKEWGFYAKNNELPSGQWIKLDICDRTPWPFPDDYFDFAICDHVLEDVRDPIHVCSELSRVAKAGYIETPSPLLELTRGINEEGTSWTGYFHHRWLVQTQDKELRFTYKPHFLMSSRRFHFPSSFIERWITEKRAYTCLYWEDVLLAEENIVVSRPEMESFIETFILEERGEILPIRYARFKRLAWEMGKELADKYGLRDTLRPLASKIWKRF